MPSRRSPIVSGVLVLLGVAVLIGLGTWQLERKAWKEGLIAALHERLAKPPMPLPLATSWGNLNAAHDEFRRVSFNAKFLNDKESRVYAVPSTFRPDVSGPGYWIFTPARLPDGHLVMVDRGFVPEGRQDPATRPLGQVAGSVRIVGALRWPEQTGWFVPKADPARNLWFRRNPAGMAAAKGLGSIAPFYVSQESPVPPGGLPKPGPIVPHLRDAHLQYAITWYGLAAILILVFLSSAVKRRREGQSKPAVLAERSESRDHKHRSHG